MCKKCAKKCAKMATFVGFYGLNYWETVEGAHAAMRLTNIEFSFDP